MLILGIETSCDETAISLIEMSGTIEADLKFKVLGESLYSQIAIHAPYGGVFPNLAKREHEKNLVPLLQQALYQAGDALTYAGPKNETASPSVIEKILEREPELYKQLSIFLAERDHPSIDAIAVTYGPGLEPALWVGVNFAKALATAWNIPLVAVNHMEGHIMAALISHDPRDLTNHFSVLQNTKMNSFAEVSFPMLSLLVSGGHTELVLSTDWMSYEIIGETRDDAAGEAFDKIARLLNLPYPGGPELSRLAASA